METEQATTLRDLAVQLAQADRDSEADATFAEALAAQLALVGLLVTTTKGLGIGMPCRRFWGKLSHNRFHTAAYFGFPPSANSGYVEN